MIQAVKRLMETYVQAIHQWIDLITAVLLLTGQITIRSVILSTGSAFSLSLSGPILGGQRAQPTSESSSVVIDTLDVLLALLLIIGEVRVVGLFIQSQHINLLVNGPPFGVPQTVAYVPTTEAFYDSLRTQILGRYHPQTNSPPEPHSKVKRKSKPLQRTKRK